MYICVNSNQNFQIATITTYDKTFSVNKLTSAKDFQIENWKLYSPIYQINRSVVAKSNSIDISCFHSAIGIWARWLGIALYENTAIC